MGDKLNKDDGQMTKFRFDINLKDIEQRRGGSSRLESNHQLESNFRATPEICSVFESDREIMYDLEGLKAARAYPLDVIPTAMGPPKVFCVAGRSTGWVRPPVVNIVSQAAQDRLRD